MTLTAEQQLLKHIFPNLEYPEEKELPKIPKELRLHWCKKHQDYYVGKQCLICRYEYHHHYSRNRPVGVKLNNKLRGYRQRNAEGSFILEEWSSKLKEYDYRCAYCGCELGSGMITIDHQIPLSRGGTNFIDNLVPACKSCNSKKHTKTADEYLLELQGG